MYFTIFIFNVVIIFSLSFILLRIINISKYLNNTIIEGNYFEIISLQNKIIEIMSSEAERQEITIKTYQELVNLYKKNPKDRFNILELTNENQSEISEKEKPQKKINKNKV